MRHLRSSADPSRVVVLGASGFIGEALVTALSERGIPLVALSTRQCDLTQPSSANVLASQLGPDDTVVFASAITREKGRDAVTFMRNLAMACHVTMAIGRRPCGHVVYLSSDAVYGHASDEPVSERTTCNPGDLYGLMHLTRERLLRLTLAEKQVPLAVLRLSLVYGARDTHASYGPNRFVREIEQLGGLTLIGDGKERRDHVYIDNAVAVILAVSARRSEGIVNVATGKSVSFAQIADVFDRVVGGPLRRTTRPRGIPLTHRDFDVSLLCRAFPEIAWTSIEDGIARIVAGRRPDVTTSNVSN
jgi:nucleoside-diphosphate-sugar epimerase